MSRDGFAGLKLGRQSELRDKIAAKGWKLHLIPDEKIGKFDDLIDQMR